MLGDSIAGREQEISKRKKKTGFPLSPIDFFLKWNKYKNTSLQIKGKKEKKSHQ